MWNRDRHDIHSFIKLCGRKTTWGKRRNIKIVSIHIEPSCSYISCTFSCLSPLLSRENAFPTRLAPVWSAPYVHQPLTDRTRRNSCAGIFAVKNTIR